MIIGASTTYLSNPAIGMTGNTYLGTLLHSNTASRNYTLPDQTGTVLLTTAYQLQVTYSTGTVSLSYASPIYLINSASPCNANLPAGVTNAVFTIRNVGTANVTVLPNGTDHVESLTSFILYPSNAINLVFYSG